MFQEKRIQKALQSRRHPLGSYSYHPGGSTPLDPLRQWSSAGSHVAPQDTCGHAWGHFWLSRVEGWEEGCHGISWAEARDATKTSYRHRGLPPPPHTELSSPRRQQCWGWESLLSMNYLCFLFPLPKEGRGEETHVLVFPMLPCGTKLQAQCQSNPPSTMSSAGGQDHSRAINVDMSFKTFRERHSSAWKLEKQEWQYMALNLYVSII